MVRSVRLVVVALILTAALTARATPERPFGYQRASDAFDADASFRMELAPLVPASLELPAEESEPVPFPVETRTRLFDGATTRFTAAYMLGVVGTGFVMWWGENEGRFSLANEGWFGRETYAGGADKASHAVLGYIGEELIEEGYRRLGHSPERARWLAVGGVAAAGVLVELGDGFSFYGASWEDAVTNVVGALFSSQVSRWGLRDTIGMRFGRVKALIPDACCRGGINIGSDYGRDIHSLDVKLAGLLPRLGVKPGPARFLMVSLTYGSKGYRFSPETHWERNIGMDLGLNLPEILRALGVRDDTWWGKPLLYAFSIFRIPYTAFGFRYDFNSGRWSGWDTGDHFDPGSVIYDRP